MKYLDLSFQTPEENLACDEALLELSEEGSNGEVLRFWQAQSYFVVLGYSRKFKQEINLKACARHDIAVLRRPSGGGTVLQGPGCLNFSLILNTQNARPIQNLTETNRYVLNQHKKSLEETLQKQIQIQGVSDLALDHLKFSGNAQRRKRKFVLFHGTFLLDFKIPMIEKALMIPLSQPAYRNNRAHKDFLTNLKVSDSTVKNALIKSWQAHERLGSIPQEKIIELVKSRYSSHDWNFKY